jgi:ABC-type sulfate transport system substrate-binding protein
VTFFRSATVAFAMRAVADAVLTRRKKNSHVAVFLGSSTQWGLVTPRTDIEPNNPNRMLDDVVNALGRAGRPSDSL